MSVSGAGSHEHGGAVDPRRALPGEWQRQTALRDGTNLLLRQIRPADREALAEGLRRLSPASRYLRFHTVVEELSDEQLTYLTDVDHVDHEAIVAIDLDRDDRPGVGVARYIREIYEPTVAEAAITVADEYHGQGAGTLLLGALAARARDNGIAVFRNYVLDGNRGMLEVFDHLGAHRELETDGLWRVDLAVPEDDGDVPHSEAGRAFLEVARDERRLTSFLPPIWSRWRGRGDDGDEGADPAAAVERDQAVGAELQGLRESLDDWLRRPDQR